MGPLPARHARRISASNSKWSSAGSKPSDRRARCPPRCGISTILRVNGFVPSFAKAGCGPSNRLTKRGPTRLRRARTIMAPPTYLNWDRVPPRVTASKCERLDLFDAGKGLDLGKNRVQKDAIDL